MTTGVTTTKASAIPVGGVARGRLDFDSFLACYMNDDLRTLVDSSSL